MYEKRCQYYVPNALVEADKQTFVNELLAEPDPNDDEDHVIPSQSIISNV